MKQIDSLLIGHNEMEFSQYEAPIRKMGTKTGAYRDLNLNFIRYKNKPYHATEIFNRYNGTKDPAAGGVKPLNMLSAFSATISYLGTYLDRRGYSFDYVLSYQDEKEELARKLTEQKVLTVAITTTYYISVFPILEIVQYIRKYDKNVKIIIGGPFISTQVRSQEPQVVDFIYHTIGADVYVNSSQGEKAMVGIIDAIKNNKSFDGIDNIYYKDGGKYRATRQEEENNRLSENMVDWNLFTDRIDEYVNVRTAISCPFACAFCGSPEHAGAYQTAGVEDIEKEFDQLAKIETLKSIHFIEDTLNVPPARFKEILRMMIKNKYPFRWHSYLRCQYMDREMAELMVESGCDGVYLGLESGNNEILHNMNKAVTVEKYREGIALLKEYGIMAHGNFIVGFPGETEKTVQDTIAFIKESGIDFFRVQQWYSMPITPIWKQKDKFGIEGKSFEWRHRTMDSKTAADIIEKIFLEVDDPVWVPQYNFDINNIYQLRHRGMSMEQIKEFLASFNRGIREKLVNPAQQEVSDEAMTRLENACRLPVTAQ